MLRHGCLSAGNYTIRGLASTAVYAVGLLSVVPVCSVVTVRLSSWFFLTRVGIPIPNPGIGDALIPGFRDYEQESCAVAKMTAQCALHMGALKIFGTPWLYGHGHYSQHFHGLLFRSTLWMFLRNLKSIAFTRSWDNRGYPKNLPIWAVPAYAHAPFSPKFLMGFYSDWPCKYTRQIWSP